MSTVRAPEVGEDARSDARKTVAPPAETPAQLLTPAFLLHTLAVAIYVLSWGMVIALLPRYVIDDLGSTPGHAGVAYGAFAITAIVTRPWAGASADRFGRQRVMVLGALCGAVAVILTPATQSYALLIALRLLWGVGQALFFVSAIAKVADLAPEGRIGEAMSYYTSLLYIGLTAGPYLGEVLLAATGVWVAWMTCGGFALLAAALEAVLAETLEPSDDAYTPATGAICREAVWPGVILFLMGCTFMAFTAFVPIWALEIGLSGSGPVFLVFGSTVLLARMLGARVPDRIGIIVTARRASLALFLGLGIIASVHNPAGLFVGAMILGFGQAFSGPMMMSAAALMVPDRRAAALGTTTMFNDLAAVVGGGLFGVFVGLADDVAAAFAAASVTGGLAVLALAWRPPAIPESATPGGIAVVP